MKILILIVLLTAVSYNVFSQNSPIYPTPVGINYNTPSTIQPIPLSDWAQMKQATIQAQQQEQQEIINKAQNLRVWYNNQTSHPTPVNNSWNDITITDYYSIYGVGQVYVTNGKVTRLLSSDGKTEFTLLKQGDVFQGKASIQLETGDFVDVYF